MMHREQEYMLFLSNLQQLATQQWSICQIEGSFDFLLNKTTYLLFAFRGREITQIQQHEPGQRFSTNALSWLSQMTWKGGAQILVLQDDGVQSQFQGWAVESSMQAIR